MCLPTRMSRMSRRSAAPSAPSDCLSDRTLHTATRRLDYHSPPLLISHAERKTHVLDTRLLVRSAFSSLVRCATSFCGLC